MRSFELVAGFGYSANYSRWALYRANSRDILCDCHNAQSVVGIRLGHFYFYVGVEDV